MNTVVPPRRMSELDLIATATSPASLWRRFEQITRQLGFPYFVYVFARADGTLFHRTNLAARHYAGPQHDPFLKYCCNNLGHTFTGAEFLPAYAYLEEGERQFIEQARGSGMRSGIGIPVRTRSNPEYGGFNLGTRLARKEFEAGPAGQVDRIRALCLLAQQRIDELGIVAAAERLPDALALASLTARETQVYRLLAAGEQRSEIARRTGISPHTVATHVKAIYRKLGVHSQAEVMQRAAAAGEGDGAGPPPSGS